MCERLSKMMEEKEVLGNITKELLHEMLQNFIDQTGMNGVQRERPVERSPSFQFHYWNNKYHLLRIFQALMSKEHGCCGSWLPSSQKRSMDVVVVGYPPLKNITTVDLSTRLKKQTYSEWTMLMKDLQAAAEKKTGKAVPKKMSEEQALELFTVAMENIPKTSCDHYHRRSQIEVTTMLRLLREAKQKKNPKAKKVPFRKRKRSKKNTSL